MDARGNNSKKLGIGSIRRYAPSAGHASAAGVCRSNLKLPRCGRLCGGGLCG